MIGFGELRKLSTQWQVDLAVVEAAYATDWLLKGIFDHPVLSPALVLTGSAALRYAYTADYPAPTAPEFRGTVPLGDDAILTALHEALQAAGRASGLQFLLADMERGAAKIEYTGPLGRRSAAQPRIVLAIVPGTTPLRNAGSLTPLRVADPASISGGAGSTTLLPPVRRPLVHPFSDPCPATVSALALEEFIAERVARLGQSPRARDVFDLWYAWQLARNDLDLEMTRALVSQIAQAKKLRAPTGDEPFAPGYRDILARTWDLALRDIHNHPSFAQIESDLTRICQILAPDDSNQSQGSSHG